MSEHKPCPFCGGQVDPRGWLRNDGARGPECENCGATAENIETWNERVVGLNGLLDLYQKRGDAIQSLKHQNTILQADLNALNELYEVDRIKELEGLVSELARLAGAGLCQMKAAGKHEFLRDISRMCENHGFDILGDPLSSPTH